jgi:hypothetical protein
MPNRRGIPWNVLPNGATVGPMDADAGPIEPWQGNELGVLELPSGRLIRGRSLANSPPGTRTPEFGLYLQGNSPQPLDWQSRWVRWPDWWLPLDEDDFREAILELWQRAPAERVEVACSAGRGRTGTALACLAILDGIPPADALAFIRGHYNPRAVETPWQRRFVARFHP